MNDTPSLATALNAAAKAARKVAAKSKLSLSDIPAGAIESSKLATPSDAGATSYGGGSIGYVIRINPQGQVVGVTEYDLPLGLIDQDLTAHKVLIGDLSGASAEATVSGGDVSGTFDAGSGGRLLLVIGSGKVVYNHLLSTIFAGAAAVTPGLTDYVVLSQAGTGTTKKALVSDLPNAVAASAQFNPSGSFVSIDPAYSYGHAHMTKPDQVGATAHGLATGTPVISGTTINGLTAWEPLYLRDIDGDNFYLYTQKASALAGGATDRIQFAADVDIAGLIHYSSADMTLVGRNVQGVFFVSKDLASGDAPESGFYLVHLTTPLDSIDHPVVASATEVLADMKAQFACAKCLSTSVIRIGTCAVIGGVTQPYDPQEISIVCL